MILPLARALTLRLGAECAGSESLCRAKRSAAGSFAALHNKASAKLSLSRPPNDYLANAQLLDRLEPISVAAGFKLPRVCTPEELMGYSDYE